MGYRLGRVPSVARPYPCSGQPFCADYETGTFDQWSNRQWLGLSIGCGGACTIDNVGNSSATIITSPLRQGSYAARYEVSSTGGGVSTINLANVLANQTAIDAFEGHEAWYGWWMYVPGPLQTWWPDGDDWNDLFQFWNNGAWIYGGIAANDGTPAIYYSSPGGKRTIADPLRYDHWYHFVAHFKWSTNAAVGLEQLWLDGENVVPLKHIQTMRSGQLFYAQGFYTARDSDNTVIHDGFCRAATYEAADTC
jgi:Polysaccharide lyase